MSRSEARELTGLLVIDKPVGLTSHDVVSRVRRIVGMKRVGHGGTLDPFATGLLVIAVGPATRVLQHVQDSDKAYLAHIVLGATTNTCDVDGVVTRRRNIGEWPDRSTVEATVDRFIGAIEQAPPAHSAIKIGGRKLYEIARAGETIDIPLRPVSIQAIEVIEYAPPDLVVAVRCGKGTYIRSLARDIGVDLGTDAYCHALRRTQSGPFCLGDAWTIEELSEPDVRDQWPLIATAPDLALVGMPAVLLGQAETAAWYHGRSIDVAGIERAGMGARVRVYGNRGQFAGVGHVARDERIAPSLVFPNIELDEEGERWEVRHSSRNGWVD